MIRKFKVLGLALVAVFAMSAVAASAASAATPGEFTSDGTVTVSGTSVGETFTYNATQKVSCAAVHTVGLPGVTPHAAFNPGAGVTTLTVQSHYSGCTATVGEINQPATVTTNGCDFVLHIGETSGVGSRYKGTADIVCGAGESIEIHVYSAANHATSICTYKIGAQTGIGGAEVENVAGGTLKIVGTATGIKASRTGIVCGGTGETSEAIQHPTAVISGKSGGGAATAISITD